MFCLKYILYNFLSFSCVFTVFCHPPSDISGDQRVAVCSFTFSSDTVFFIHFVFCIIYTVCKLNALKKLIIVVVY